MKDITLSSPGLADAVRSVSTGLADIAQAIREHTEHVKMDDERYWDEKNADVKEEAPIFDAPLPRPSYTPPTVFDEATAPRSAHPSTHASGTAADVPFNEWQRNIFDQMFSRHRPSFKDSRRPFPDFVVEFMQTTPHAFRRAPYSGTPAPCRICELPQGNPVHTILLPEFKLED